MSQLEWSEHGSGVGLWFTASVKVTPSLEVYYAAKSNEAVMGMSGFDCHGEVNQTLWVTPVLDLESAKSACELHLQQLAEGFAPYWRWTIKPPESESGCEFAEDHKGDET